MDEQLSRPVPNVWPKTTPMKDIYDRWRTFRLHVRNRLKPSEQLLQDFAEKEGISVQLILAAITVESDRRHHEW